MKTKKRKNGKNVKKDFLKEWNFIILLSATIVYNFVFLRSIRSINYAFLNELFKSRLLEFFFKKILINLSSIFFIINDLASLGFIMFFYFITKEIFKNEKIAFYSSLMILISPIYVFLFSSINHFFIFTILFLAGFFLKLKGHNISGTLFLISCSFNYMFLIASIFTILYFDFGKKKKTAIFFDIILLALYAHYVFLRSFFNLKFAYYPLASITEVLFELSSFLSIRLIVFILATIATISLSYKKEFTVFDSLLLLIILMSIFLSTYSKYSLILAALFLNMLSGVGIYYIIHNKRSHKLLKVLILGLLFVLIAFPEPILIVKNTTNAARFNEMMSILNFNQNLTKKMVVSPTQLCLFSVLGGKNAFFDNNLCSDFYNSNTRQILRTLSLKNSTTFLEKILVENNKPTNENLNRFNEFLSIIDLHEFQMFVKKNQIQGIILTSDLEQYLANENPVLLRIIKSYNKNQSENKVISFES